MSDYYKYIPIETHDGSTLTDTNSATVKVRSYDPITPDHFGITLFKSTAEVHRVDKTDYLTIFDTIEGTLRESCSISTPIITFEMEEFPLFNYVYIAPFNRYYFVTEIVSIRQNLWEMHLDIDLLMTYKEGIKGLSAFIDRNEFDYNEDIIDNKRVLEQGFNISTHRVDNEIFNSKPTYVLTTFNGYCVNRPPDEEETSTEEVT